MLNNQCTIIILKFIWLILIFCILIIYNNKIIISSINLSFYKNIELYYSLSFCFTIFCFLVFMNAFNMFDGINLQSITYSTFVFFIFYFLSAFEIFYLIIIICLLFLFALNLKNKIFLGDSGIYIIGAFISLVVISEYNKQSITFFADDIFILMMIPGLDFIRVFMIRISKGRNPFLGDKNHLHHLMINQFGFLKSYLFIVFLYVSPFLLKLIHMSNFYIIILYVIIYSTLLLYVKKNTVRKRYN